MSLWKWAGAVAGGVGGFLAAGPAGAVAGASLGYGAGASADASNAEDDAKDANNAALAGIKVAPGAWTPTGGSLGTGEAPKSDHTKYLEGQIAGQTQSVAEQEALVRSLDNDPHRLGLESEKLAKMQHILDGLKSELSVQQEKDLAPQRDAIYAAQKAKEAEGRAAPAIDRTKIQETDIDFGQSDATLAGSKEFRDAQLAQAGRLQSGAGGEGQQDLVDRLKASTGGEGQAKLIERLEGDVNGNQPSLAQLQLEEGRDASINNAMSIANSARGNTMAMSQLEALKANQAAMQTARREAAMLRAQEYAQARGELAGAYASKRGMDLQGLGLEGTTLSQKRGQDLQGENIAATELGQGRQQDLGTAGIQSQNALSQAQIDQATRLAQAQLDDGTKRTNLQAYFQQQGLNAAAAEYWADKYTHFKERPEDLAIDREKTQAGIQTHIADSQIAQTNADLDRSQKRDAAIGQGLATMGTSIALGGVKGGTPGSPTDSYSRYTTAAGDDWKFGRTG